MTEKEKMLEGLPYNASDDQLVRERRNARRLVWRINQTLPDQGEERAVLFRRLIGAKGQFTIEPPFYCDYGYNITIGENFYANYNCTMLDVAPVTIGDNVMFGPQVQIYTAEHPVDARKRITGIESGKPIVIGSNVWIGGGAILCPGVSIGDNTVIGAGSVVTKDIPADAVAAGNPCRILRRLDCQEEETEECMGE